jgi:hypothetical protein
MTTFLHIDKEILPKGLVNLKEGCKFASFSQMGLASQIWALDPPLKEIAKLFMKPPNPCIFIYCVIYLVFYAMSLPIKRAGTWWYCWTLSPGLMSLKSSTSTTSLGSLETLSPPPRS